MRAQPDRRPRVAAWSHHLHLGHTGPLDVWLGSPGPAPVGIGPCPRAVSSEENTEARAAWAQHPWAMLKTPLPASWFGLGIGLLHWSDVTAESSFLLGLSSAEELGGGVPGQEQTGPLISCACAGP